jgi:hypothetical protein
LPEFVCQSGDVRFFEFVSDSIGALSGPRPLMLLLCHQVSLIAVLAALSGAFISGEVIFCAVMFGAGAVGMGGNVPAFGCYLL